MRESRIVIILAGSLMLGALAGGCGVQSTAPPSPTYEADVKPIITSRCLRCHGAGGMLNDDIDHTGVSGAGPGGGAPTQGYFNQLEDTDCDPVDGGVPKTCKRGLLYYATTAAARLKNYIHSADPNGRMPPPPSPGLTTRQLEVMDNWMAESPPM